MHKTIENKRWIDEMCPSEDERVKIELDQELFLFENICENNNEYLVQTMSGFDLEHHTMDLYEYQDLLLKLESEIQIMLS